MMVRHASMGKGRAVAETKLAQRHSAKRSPTPPPPRSAARG